MNDDLRELIAFYVRHQVEETELMLNSDHPSETNFAHCQFCAAVVRSIMIGIMEHDLRYAHPSRKYAAGKSLLDYFYIERAFLFNFN